VFDQPSAFAPPALTLPKYWSNAGPRLLTARAWPAVKKYRAEAGPAPAPARERLCAARAVWPVPFYQFGPRSARVRPAFDPRLTRV
jgi:hypothetical protein